MRSDRSPNGDRLFEIVADYWALGDHRTGSVVDGETADWMAGLLGEAGVRVEIEPVPFDAWHAESSLTAGTGPIDHLVVPYEWTGSLQTDHVHVARIDPKTGGRPGALAEPVAAAQATGAAAAVCATDHPEGSLVAINRELGAATTGFPTVLIAGRDFERAVSGPLHLEVDAATRPAATSNVVATNAVHGLPLLLTTPLNGWFGCAGERGTGIAVLIHLVDALADLPLLVLATGGHELGWFGANRWVDAATDPAAAIVHVGASAAVLEPGPGDDRLLAGTRVALTSLSGAAADAIEAAMAPTAMLFRAAAEQWLGEGQAFSRLGVPLLSMSGAGRDFHSPEDTPERATSPAALATVADAVADAARRLYTVATARQL